MSLVNEVINFFMKSRIGRINHFKAYPIETQTEVFNTLIDRAKFTEFGKNHHFNKITTIKEFQEQVPVSTYEEFFPWLSRVLEGEKNILWPSNITWFSKSSGTTNARSKFIPVSEEALYECNYMGGKDLLTLYFENRPDSQLFSGKSISIGGSLQSNPYNESVLAGDVSAIITNNLPKWAEYFRSPSKEIALIAQWKYKLEMMLKTCPQENIISIWGVPTWTLVFLEKMIEEAGANSVLDIWPNFEVFYHGGVSFSPFRSLFKEKLFPSDQVVYMETYNASEGFFAIQDDFSLQDQMLLMLDYGIFYEFLPMGEWDKPFPKALTLDEVELDKSYAMVISSNAGLWRYKLGDTVKFTSKYPFRIKISGRIKHFINTFGEEVVIENTDEAIAFTCEEFGVQLKEYTAAPIYMESGAKGGHEWVVELDKLPDNPQAFTERLDNKLREINSDYDAKRQNDIALERLKIHFAPTGTFMKWLEGKGKLGGQNKVPRLSNERDFLEEIISFI